MTMTKGEAIGFLEKCRYWFMPYTSEEDTWNEALDMAIEALRFDRPQGEWIDVNGDGSLWRCSRCEDTACCNGNYCPTCGAYMKNGDTE